MTITINLMDKLEKRGIAAAAIANEWRAAQWTIHLDDGSTLVQDGYDAPLFDAMGKRIINRKKGKPLLTWKNADSAGDPHDVWKNYIEGFKPLMLPKNAIMGSVKHADGKLNLCEGKADTLSMWAAKIGNCIGVFGASMIPADLLEQLQKWQVTILRMFVHPDEAGHKSAQKVADLLRGQVEIHFMMLPEIEGKKFDVNDFWVRSGFDTKKFRAALSKLPEQPFEAQPIPEWKPAPTTPTDIPLSRIQSYANAAFSGIISELLSVTSGRNIALNNAAYGAGRFVGAGGLEESRVEYELVMAGETIGLGHRASVATVQSGLKAGVKNPADLSNMKPQTRNAPHTNVRIIEASDEGVSSETAEPDDLEKTTNVRSKLALTKARRAEKVACQTSDTLPMPFQTVAQKRGFASAFKRKKVYAFIADSGAGKSSMIETLIDSYLQSGYSGVIYTPEWDGDEWVMAAIQRLGGPTYMEQVAHDTRQSAFDDEREREYQTTTDHLLDVIDSWPGNIYFVDQVVEPCSEDIIAGMNAAFVDGEAKGTPLSFAVVDYAQMFLSRLGKTELEQMNRALYQFKKFCQAHDAVGIVGSQITKESGDRSGRPRHTGMMGARSDTFNFAAFIVRERDADDSYKPDAWLHVVKNSRGKLGKAEIYQHPETAAWHSGRWNPNAPPAIPHLNQAKKDVPVKQQNKSPLPNSESEAPPTVKAQGSRAEVINREGERYGISIGSWVMPNTLAMMRVMAKRDGHCEEFEAALYSDELQWINLLDSPEGDNAPNMPEWILLKP